MAVAVLRGVEFEPVELVVLKRSGVRAEVGQLDRVHPQPEVVGRGNISDRGPGLGCHCRRVHTKRKGGGWGGRGGREVEGPEVCTRGIWLRTTRRAERRVNQLPAISA